MPRLFYLTCMILCCHARAQFQTVRAPGEVKISTPFYGQVDFNEIDAHFDFSQLDGEELYFAKRATLPSGHTDSMPPFANMEGDNPQLISDLMSTGQSKQIINSPYRDWVMTGRNVTPSTRFFQPNLTYVTYAYLPTITIDQKARTLTATTPYAALEDKFFTVVSCRDSGNNGLFCYLLIHLRDDSGRHLRWVVHTRELSKYGAHIKTYLTRLRRAQIGVTYYYNPTDKREREVTNVLTNAPYVLHEGGRFTVKDVMFIDSRYAPRALPWLLFADTAGNELAVAPKAGQPYPTTTPRLGMFTDEAKIRQLAGDVALLADSMQEHYELVGDSLQRAYQQRERLLSHRFGKANASQIIAGKVTTGMTTAMCRAAWGEPVVVQETINKNGKVLFWRYGVLRWLKFLNGTLVSFSY